MSFKTVLENHTKHDNNRTRYTCTKFVLDYSCDSFAGEKSNTGEKFVISYCNPYTIPPTTRQNNRSSFSKYVVFLRKCVTIVLCNYNQQTLFCGHGTV